MTRSHRHRLIAIIPAFTLLIAGCDPDWPGTNETAIVQGKVLLDGVPLSDARVTFIPITPIDSPVESLKPMSYAVTDVNGKYSLSQADGTAGAATGQHTVIISKPISRKFQLKDDELTAKQMTDAVPDFYRQHGYLKRHVMPLPGSHQMDFKLSTIDPLLN